MLEKISWNRQQWLAIRIEAFTNIAFGCQAKTRLGQNKLPSINTFMFQILNTPINRILTFSLERKTEVMKQDSHSCLSTHTLQRNYILSNITQFSAALV